MRFLEDTPEPAGCQARASSVQDRGLFGPFIGPRPKFRGVLASRASEGQGGGSGAEPDGPGIRPVGIDRRPAPVLGAVPERTSPDAVRLLAITGGASMAAAGPSGCGSAPRAGARQCHPLRCHWR